MKSKILKIKSHGLSDVPGFETAGVSCDIRGLKNDRLDLALIHSPLPCRAAGVFTRNAVPAACVQGSREVLRSGAGIHGIVANSGNANAWTGPSGREDAAAMQALAAACCGGRAQSFFVCSTGRIGRRLPMGKIRKGVQEAARRLGSTPRHGLDAARAILTSDTREKVLTRKIPWEGKTITVGGMAKGAGMIQPDMATMLAFIATDARVGNRTLQKILEKAVKTSFNAITIDGDMSTNDTVLLLANGHSGIRVKASDAPLKERFCDAVKQICEGLAEMIVSDGEKITKVIAISIEGAKSRADAEKAARAIGNSLLVKTSWYGGDPNWGRVVDAAGYSGAALVEKKLDMAYRTGTGRAVRKTLPVLEKGIPLTRNTGKWKTLVSAPKFEIILNLHLGKGAFRLLSTDLSEGYVNYNRSE